MNIAMVSTLDIGRGHCVVFLGRTLLSLGTVPLRTLLSLGTVPLHIQQYKWFPANLKLGIAL